jgi:hypothetical protein
MAPKAARIPNAERVLRPNELELEVLDRYFDKGYLLDSKGDRLKPRVIPEGNLNLAKKAMDKGKLPEEGKIVFEDSRGCLLYTSDAADD